MFKLNFKRKLFAARNAGDIIFKRKLLAVETSGEVIRAAVVQKAGKAFEVLDFTVIARPDPDDDLPAVEAVKLLTERLKYDGTAAVFVTSIARAFAMPMDRKKVARLKHQQLKEAVKWEVEPFTGIHGGQALIGVSKEDLGRRRPGEVVEEEDELPVSVSALERNIFRAIRERFKLAGLRLINIYPPDICFYMPLYMAPFEAPRAVLDIGPDYSNFAILKGDHEPTQINTLTASIESIQSLMAGDSETTVDLENTLKFIARQVPPPLPLVISGEGAKSADVVAYLDTLCPNGTEPLKLSRAAKLTGKDEDAAAGAAFSTVIGAAVRQLRSATDRQLGINDRVPLLLRIRKSAYMMPLVVTVVLFLGLSGHYQFMKFRERSYRQRITTLKTDVKRKQKKVDAYQALKTQANQLEEQIDQVRKKMDYLINQVDDQAEHVIGVLHGTATALPKQVVLETLNQQDGDCFRLIGTSTDLSSIGIFATGMQKYDWCRTVSIEAVQATPAGLLEFTLAIKTEKPAS